MKGELKVNDFVMFQIEVECKFFGGAESEAEFMGQTRKVNKGQFFAKVSGKVTYDYQKKYTTDTGKMFLDLLIKTFLKKYYEIKYEDVLYYDVIKLQTLIKENAFMDTGTNAF